MTNLVPDHNPGSMTIEVVIISPCDDQVAQKYEKYEEETYEENYSREESKKM